MWHPKKFSLIPYEKDVALKKRGDEIEREPKFTPISRTKTKEREKNIFLHDFVSREVWKNNKMQFLRAIKISLFLSLALFRDTFLSFRLIEQQECRAFTLSLSWENEKSSGVFLFEAQEQFQMFKEWTWFFFLTLLSKLSCHALALINFDERKSIFTVSQTVETGEKKIDFSVMKTIFGSKSQRSDE